VTERARRPFTMWRGRPRSRFLETKSDENLAYQAILKAVTDSGEASLTFAASPNECRHSVRISQGGVRNAG